MFQNRIFKESWKKLQSLFLSKGLGGIEALSWHTWLLRGGKESQSPNPAVHSQNREARLEHKGHIPTRNLSPYPQEPFQQASRKTLPSSFPNTKDT